MAKLSIPYNSTSETVDLFFQDPVSGAGFTGLLYSTASLTCSYNRRRGTPALITLVDLASPAAAYLSGGFKELDSINQPGMYRFDVPDSLLASSPSRYVKIYFRSPVTAPCILEIQLIDATLDPWLTPLPATYPAGTAGNILGNPINSNLLTYSSGKDPATMVLGATASSWNAAGTIGNKINSAASAGDPWSSPLPASYAPGSAGYILGHPIPAVVNSYSTGQNPATLILGSSASSWNSPGTIGDAINDASDAGDPWGANLPSTYPPGTAGYIIGALIDAAISSRLPSGPVTVGAYSSGKDPATLVLDTSASGHNTSGTIGQKINSAASAGDPWTTTLPGSYIAGQAGYLIGHNLNETVASRQPSGPVTVGFYSVNKDPASQVLNALAASYNLPNTIGEKINDAGLAGDPWTAILPSSYPPNSAGNILGNRLDALISSRHPNAPVTVAAYSSGQDPATLVLDATASSFNDPGSIGNKINSTGDPWGIDVPATYPPGSAGYILGYYLDEAISTKQNAGPVLLNLSQHVPTGLNGNSVGECLNASRVQGFGRWNLDTDNKILYIYNYDGSLAKQFVVDDIEEPTSRTPF